MRLAARLKRLAHDRRCRIAGAVLAVAAFLGAGESATAAPTCPDQEVSTAYETPVTVTLTCTDPEYPIVSYSLLGSPPTVLPGNTTTYTPPAGFSGRTLAFSYQGSNSIGASDFGVVYVTVAPKPAPPPPPPPPPNRPPVARCDFYNAKRGEPLEVPRERGLLANDTDPDGDELLAAELDSKPVYLGPQLKPGGGFRFSPSPNAKAMVLTYSYRVRDNRGGVSEPTT
jgi:hypothetical protein